MYFFEMFIRIHRADIGGPYTGLKRTGRDLEPAIPGADLVLESGNVTPLTNLLVEIVRTKLQDRYKKAMAAKSIKVQDVDAGRCEYTATYV